MYDELPQTDMPLSKSHNVWRAKKKKHVGLNLLVALLACVVALAGVLTYLNYTSRLDVVWQALVKVWQTVAGWFRSLAIG